MRKVKIKYNKGLVDVDLSTEDDGEGFNIVKNLPESRLQDLYAKKIRQTIPIVLPPAIRYMSADQTVLIWERPPAYHTINYSPLKQHQLQASTDSAIRRRIPVPWQVYVIGFNSDYVIHNMYMFFRNAPLADGDTSVCFAPLNNFYEDNRLCQAVYDNIPDASNLFQMLNNAYDMVWNSGFNEDLSAAINSAYRNSRNHPILMYIGKENSRKGYYTAWANHTIDEVVEMAWPEITGDVFQFVTSMERTASQNINVTQFVMDVQDA